MAGDPNYVVKQGDCISSLADANGLLPKTLWNANPDLKAKRDNANVLMPGDELIIPDINVAEYTKPTDATHKFVVQGTTTKFRLVVERYRQPLKNKKFILKVDGVIHQGTTSGTGLLEVPLPAQAQSGHLQIPDEYLECDLQFGYLDPHDQLTGAQGRLQNLGYYHGEIDGESNDEFQAALSMFQSDSDLPVTGKLDDATTNKLKLEHDLEHAYPPPAAPPPQTASNQSNDIPPDESDVPTDAEDQRLYNQLVSSDDD